MSRNGNGSHSGRVSCDGNDAIVGWLAGWRRWPSKSLLAGLITGPQEVYIGQCSSHKEQAVFLPKQK